MPPKTKQAEEERLLLESSRHVTRTATALFYGNGFIVSALPLCTLTRERERERGEGGCKREGGNTENWWEKEKILYYWTERAIPQPQGSTGGCW